MTEKLKLLAYDAKDFEILSALLQDSVMPVIEMNYNSPEKQFIVITSRFDWDNKRQVWQKVLEEIEELKVEIKKGDSDRIASEFGDVLFALTNYSRFINVNPEDALERTHIFAHQGVD